MKRNYLIISFIVVALIQLAVPVKMVVNSKLTESNGTIFKFKTVPIDPTDPFSGKYIYLDYEIGNHATADTTFTRNDAVYVVLENDSLGFAKIKSLQHTTPGGGDYVSAKVVNSYKGEVIIGFPFERFYMEESKAYEAETAYAEFSSGKNAKPAYAVVAVLNGNAVLKDVIIDSMPIKEYVERERLNNTKAASD